MSESLSRRSSKHIHIIRRQRMDKAVLYMLHASGAKINLSLGPLKSMSRNTVTGARLGSRYGRAVAKVVARVQ